MWNWLPKERNVELTEALRAACFGVKELGLKQPIDVTVCFGGEEMEKILNLYAPLTIIVELLFDKPECTPEVRSRLAAELGGACKRFFHLNMFTDRPVQVAVKRFNPEHDAFWNG